jgi:hypothetical protein
MPDVGQQYDLFLSFRLVTQDIAKKRTRDTAGRLGWETADESNRFHDFIATGAELEGAFS